MRLICTESGVRGKGLGVRRGSARRGTAEIELMLVIPVLLVILFLAGAALKIGKAWMGNAYNAENDVYGQVVAGRGLTISAEVVPVEGINGVKPALPNRYAWADEQQVVVIEGVKGVPAIGLEDEAILLDPSWALTGWPQTGDAVEMEGWFRAYVEESHPSEVVEALGLREPGPP
jgi:hypothetical protein